MNRVVIVTPGQLGMNPRTVKEATSLHQAGFRVTVVCTRLSSALDQRDSTILGEIDWDVDRVDFGPRPAWWFERGLNEAARILAAASPFISRQPFLAGYAHSPMARRLLAATLRHPADLYIAHYPAALPAAVAAARRHGARFAFDAEDFHPGDLPDEPSSRRPNQWIDAIERNALPRAAYVTAASPGIADAYAERYGIARPTVVRNVFPLTEAPEGPSAGGTVTPGPTLYWFSQVRGRDRGLECALEAIALARTRPHLHIRGAARMGFDQAYLTRAKALGCADRIHFLDPAAPMEMARLAAGYDAGLASETGGTANHRIALANKIFTYILAGTVSMMSDIPAHVAFADEAGDAVRLYRTEDPRSLAAVLDDLFEDPARLARARAAAYALGQTRLNWEAEATLLLKCVADALGE